MKSMQSTLNVLYRCLKEARLNVEADLKTQEIGSITRLSTGIALVSGLPNVGFDEL
jgi:F-type H+-transporting ATPase subunit alpha